MVNGTSLSKPHMSVETTELCACQMVLGLRFANLGGSDCRICESRMQGVKVGKSVVIINLMYSTGVVACEISETK